MYSTGAYNNQGLMTLNSSVRHSCRLDQWH